MKLNPRLGSRRGDMVKTLYDSKRQASLSSGYLVRVGLSSLVHSFKLSGNAPPAARVFCRSLVFPAAPFGQAFVRNNVTKPC